MARVADELVSKIFETDELREHILDISFTTGPAVVAMRRFGRASQVCKAWQQVVWGGGAARLIALLTRLAAEHALPVVRLAAAFALRPETVRIKYLPSAASEQATKLKRALACGLLRDHGGWAAVRRRMREATREEMAEERVAAVRQRSSAIGRVDAIHIDPRSRLHAWENAKKETVRVLTVLRRSREAEAAGEMAVSEALLRLERERMTLSALQATQVGATVNSLRKSDSARIVSASQRLTKAWKAIAGQGGREMDAGSGIVDRSGKRPPLNQTRSLTQPRIRAQTCLCIGHAHNAHSLPAQHW